MVFKLQRFGTVLFVYKTLPLIEVLYGIYVLNRNGSRINLLP